MRNDRWSMGSGILDLGTMMGIAEDPGAGARAGDQPDLTGPGHQFFCSRFASDVATRYAFSPAGKKALSGPEPGV